MQRSQRLISLWGALALVSAGGLSGYLKGPTAAYGDASATVRTAAPAVPQSTLTPAVMAVDTQSLAATLKSHPGDGITRGPDQLVYNINVAIDAVKHRLSGNLAVHFHNNLATPIQTLYFNVWPDAPHYTKAGGRQVIQHVTVDGRSQPFSLHGTVLTIRLDKPVQPGSSAVATMDITAQLPHILDRYGWNGTTMTFGNWFPMLAVHDQYGWVTPPYYTDGESFYSLTGDFHLHVRAPKQLVLAISGQQQSAVPDGHGNVTYTYTAQAVRDIAMVGDSRYRVLTKRVGQTTVYTYYTPAQASQAQLMQSVGVRAVAAYSREYGTYPYPTLRICPMSGWFGGMEYPQLVMISFGSGGNSTAATTVYVAHEVAHQWFFGMVGDDEYLTPWVDEAFATFSENRFDHTLSSLQHVISVPERASDPVSAFPSSDFPASASQNTSVNDYYYAVYLHGASAIDALMTRMGQQKFNAMMQSYFHQYQFRVATIQDFIDAASRATNTDMAPWFQAHGIVATDALHAPVSRWVPIETRQNQRAWH